MDVGSHEEYLESDVDGIVLIVLELLWHELLVVLHSPSLLPSGPLGSSSPLSLGKISPLRSKSQYCMNDVTDSEL